MKKPAPVTRRGLFRSSVRRALLQLAGHFADGAVGQRIGLGARQTRDQHGLGSLGGQVDGGGLHLGLGRGLGVGDLACGQGGSAGDGLGQLGAGLGLQTLGPVLGGLMVAARVASSIAAELGTMKVTEQIDALTTLSTNPMKYLAVPRILAATLAVPVLVAVGDSIGIAGGWLVGISRLDFNAASYLKNTTDFLQFWDVGSGLVKGAVFGFIVALMGCYMGMTSGRGAQGVGAATKAAVVAASVLILASNYVLTEVFFSA